MLWGRLTLPNYSACSWLPTFHQTVNLTYFPGGSGKLAVSVTALLNKSGLAKP
jgi:hypothetical protein